MGHQERVLIIDDRHFDLSTYRWDDNRFSEMLTRDASLSLQQAMETSRFIREEIARIDLQAINIPVIEQLIESKLREYGIPVDSKISLDRSFLIKNGPMLSENAKTVLERRYLKKDRKGNPIETSELMFRRVAHHIARAEKKFKEGMEIKKAEELFFNMMTELKFLPNSPTLMNAGRRLGQLAACFVLPIKDSMEEIFDSLKHAAIIHKSGGGTGFSFSRLRPANSRVGSTGGVASGPVSFMKVFNTATEQVKQGGTRRGANMAVLKIDHPDIMEFICCKQDNFALSNFNISVGITDQFMDAVKEEKSFALINPGTQKKTGKLNAKEVYSILVSQAWKNGDPGIIFLDRINKDNPTPALGEIESTNPCGEQPLLPMESCNLGSINLARFTFKKELEYFVDYESLKETVWAAIRFLDNTIEMSKFPLPEIGDMVKGNRKVGLGIMGFADLLFKLKIPYNSEEALGVAEKIMDFVQKESKYASRFLAKKRGVFKNINKSIFKGDKTGGFRNATTTTIAPTGTLSIIAGCSSGIEPLFALSFVRTVMDDDKLLEVNPFFEQIARERGFYSKELMNKIAENGGIKEITEIPEDVRKIFVTAHDISPEWHVRMQAAFQKYTDNAVSKTVNLPGDATVEDVKRVYDLAYRLGCKGVTIYRDGSKAGQVLSVLPKQEPEDGFMRAVKQRPVTLEGFTTKIRTGLGQLYINVTEYDGRPFEVFATIGKSGKSTTAKTEAIGRLISLALRSGVEVEDIIEQIKGISGEHTVFQNGITVLSIPDAIGKILEERYLKDGKSRKGTNHGNTLKGNECPECGQIIRFEEGCMTCHSCGYTLCG